MKTTSSNLATATGLIILLVLLILAAYLHIAVLEVFLIILLLLCFAAYLWAKKATDRILVSFREREIHLFPQEQITLHMHLQNQKFLPVIWLKLFVKGSESGILETAAGNEISESFSWIMPQQSLSWEHAVTGLTRGVCSMDTVSLLSGDGFGLTDRSREISAEKPFRLVVYPRILPVDHELIRKHMKELELSRTGLYQDRSLLKYTRPYTGRENLRDINWRSLARGGEEQVNIWETMAPERAAFLPDFRSFVYQETIRENNEEKIVFRLYEEAFETMLSLIASLIVHAGNRDLRFSLLLPSAGSLPARVCIPEDHTLQIPELLEILAEINYNCEESVFEPQLALEQRHRLGQIYVVSRRAGSCTVRLPEDLTARYLVLDDTDRGLVL